VITTGILSVQVDHYDRGLGTMAETRSSRLVHAAEIINFLRSRTSSEPEGNQPVNLGPKQLSVLRDPTLVRELPQWLQAAGGNLPVTVDGDAWTAGGAFLSTLPVDRRLGWGSWSGADTHTGRLESAPIKIERAVLVIPIAGYPTLAGNSLMVVPDRGGPSAAVKYDGANAGESWREWHVNTSQFIGQNVRIVAVDGNTGTFGWLGLAVPYQSSRLMHLTNRLLAQFGPLREMFVSSRQTIVEWLLPAMLSAALVLGARGLIRDDSGATGSR
jgi:hypothetical protein